MARTIDDIQTQIIEAVQAEPALSTLNSSSVTAIWRLWTRVVAFAIAALENLFDLYRDEVDSNIALMKPHTARWYQFKSLAYLHGFDLIEGKDTFDVTGVDESVVEDARIIAAAAAVESGGILTLKANKEVDGGLVPLSTDEYDGFAAYWSEIKDAGVDLQILSFQADKMVLQIDIYYDPLILGSSGQRLDGSVNEPVKSAIEAFLKNLPFNGQFVRAHLVDRLQAVEGVFVPVIRSCQITRFDSVVFTEVDVTYDPYAGFIRVYEDADYQINYIPNV